MHFLRSEGVWSGKKQTSVGFGLEFGPYPVSDLSRQLSGVLTYAFRSGALALASSSSGLILAPTTAVPDMPSLTLLLIA
jgi:hypothetical protein